MEGRDLLGAVRDNNVEGVKRMVREPGRDLNWRDVSVSVCGRPVRLVELVRVPSWLVGQVGGVPLGVGVSPPFTAAHPPPAPRSTLRVAGVDGSLSGLRLRSREEDGDCEGAGRSQR